MPRQEAGFSREMAAAYGEIERALSGARRRQGWIAAAEALGYGLSGAFAALLAGALAVAWGAGPWARAAALTAAAAAAAAAAVRAAWRLWHTVRSQVAAARTLSGDDPALRSDLLSSVELERERPEVERSGRFSLALLDGHIARTAERARGLDLRRAIPALPARRAGLAAAGVAGAHLLALGLVGAPLGRAYGRVLSGDRLPASAPRADPITGDVEITYRYPAYMRRPERKLSGTGGEVTAPRGTEVGLRTRSDRPVAEAQLLLEGKAGPQEVALSVEGGRDLSGGFRVDDGGSYRFRFTRGTRVVALGPPIPVAIEPDAFPEVRILSPAAEVEVGAGDRVRVEWAASDDFGLTDLALAEKPPGAEERRRVVRTFGPGRRESGSFDLDLAPLRLAEAEKLLYWLEVRDNDAVSGPKRSASATHVVKVFSQAEHHRAALERAGALWEEMVRFLGDRLEKLPRGEGPSAEQLAAGESLDGRARALHGRLREGAAELRRDRSAPAEIARALSNVADGIRGVEQRLSPARLVMGRFLRTGRADEVRMSRQLLDLDAEMDAELEKDVLYLEALFDKRRAEDLVRLAKDLAQRRRDLASLLERYRKSPGEEARKELLAEVARLRQRMHDLMRRMAELAKGIDDEHMNAEALAEVARSRDLMGNLERLEKLLAQGDLDAAMKELDALGSAMQQMLASLERTAGHPDRQNAALMKEMLDFRRRMEEVQAAQERLAQETDRVKGEYRRRVAERMRAAEEHARRMEELARQARERVQQAGKGATQRSEDSLAMARDRLADLEKALAMRDLDAALETVRRALPPMQRLAAELADDALVLERYPDMRAGNPAQVRDPARIREAAQKAQSAIPPARQVREELERLFPDPRSVLGAADQGRLERLARRQAELGRETGGMQRRLQELAQRAPVFPLQASRALGESRGHMEQAAEELSRRNPQRGHAEQRQALDALARLRRGLEEMARRRGGGGDGGGFPYPFAAVEAGGQEGMFGDSSREKVEIPGADAHKPPEEFRRDLLEAMKQGVPEAYRAEVQRYYEELVR